MAGMNVRTKSFFWVVIFGIMSLYGTIVGTFIIYKAYPQLLNKDGSVDYDYAGVIVGVLAILFAFTLGWQIFNTIDLKRKIEEEIDESRKERDEIKKDLLFLKEDASKYNYKMRSNVYIAIGYIHFVDGLYLEAYEDYTNTLWNILQIEEKDDKICLTISTCLINMGKCIKKLKERENKDFRMSDPQTFKDNIRDIIESHSPNFTKEKRELLFKLESERKDIIS